MNDHALRIVALGDLTADLILEVPELPIRAEDFQIADAIHLEPGGSANLLILLSRLGASAVALGTLGDDLWGEQVYQILETEGVEVSPIRRQGTTTVALVLVDGKGRHSFIGAYGKGKPLTLGDREARIITAADALFASGYSMAEARMRDLTLEALEAAGQRRISRFFDPGPAFRNLKEDIQLRALASCDVLLLTEEELRDLSPEGAEVLLRWNRGAMSGDTTRFYTAAGAPDFTGRTGPHTVVVKRSAQGCRVYGADARSVDVPGMSVPVRDTTAAGDCFDAVYIWAHLKGRSAEECARLANCAAAAAVVKLGGGRNVPTREEVQEMIGQMGEGIGALGD
jgi:ribokinase